MGELKIVVPENFTEFGNKVNEHLRNLRESNDNYIVNADFIRFNNGEGKVILNETLRGKDLYIMSDVTNYDISYMSHGRVHYMSPDEHFQDIKRVLSAECGHAAKRTVVMPYLYQSRQDKKEMRESLDCANALKELENMRVGEIVTCDVHNKGIMNAVPTLAFENLYLSDMLILDLLTNEGIDDFSKVICVSPDEGGMKRARFFSELVGNCEVVSFYKQRDYTTIIDGKNPIVDHRFLGPSDLRGKNAVIIDDMIASGSSILETALELKKLGADNVYLMVTFALFTSGIDKFNYYYDHDIIDRVYASNVCYVPEEYKKMPWFRSVDCSYRIANLISELNYGNSIRGLLNCKTESAVKIKSLRRKYEKI